MTLALVVRLFCILIAIIALDAFFDWLMGRREQRQELRDAERLQELYRRSSAPPLAFSRPASKGFHRPGGRSAA